MLGADGRLVEVWILRVASECFLHYSSIPTPTRLGGDCMSVLEIIYGVSWKLHEKVKSQWLRPGWVRVKFWDAGCKKPHEQIRMLKERPEVVIQHSKLNPFFRARPLFVGCEIRIGLRCRYRSPKPCFGFWPFGVRYCIVFRASDLVFDTPYRFP